ncbi:MAG: caspase family protein [Lewinellaceae bacterium]|nr:caspase family protein [Lewinellaceae bacterium]
MKSDAAGSLKDGKSWFLGIGINNYQHFRRLNNAVSDVKAILAVLKNKYEVDQSITLFNEEATFSKIIQSLDSLAKVVQRDDKLLIYFSGHGTLSQASIGCWIPFDADAQSTSNYFPNSRLRDYLNEIQARHILIIADSCFSGSILITRSAFPRPEEILERMPSRYAICSGRYSEEVNDGPPGGHSPFAEGILKVLEQNSEPKLRTSLLAERVMDLAAAKALQYLQHGRIFGVQDEQGQYVFRLRHNEDNIWETCRYQDTIDAYHTYLEESSAGKYSTQALERLSQLEKAKEILSRRKEVAEIGFGTFEDPRDGSVYRTIKAIGLTWLADNLRFDAGDECWFYNGDATNEEAFGRLYTWEAAIKACPLGWRLPTDEEWREMAGFFGKKEAGYSKNEERAKYVALIEGGKGGFSAKLGGARDTLGNFYGKGGYGFYWSSTEGSSENAWRCLFYRSQGVVLYNHNEKRFGFSCRCVRK